MMPSAELKHCSKARKEGIMQSLLGTALQWSCEVDFMFSGQQSDVEHEMKFK